MVEKFFWADQIAERVIKEKGRKKEYVCASGVTPSGIAHMGHLREVITTELVVRALREKGKKVRMIYSWDDYDRFRKVPINVPKEYEKYLGVPVSEFPSPFDKKLDYARYFEIPFEGDLKVMGIAPEFIRQSKMNKKCAYAKLIRKTLDDVEKIKKILNKYRGEVLGKDWLPIMVYCEKCNKDLTKIIDIKNYVITYECECGDKDTFDFRKKGLVSIKWRVDWPLRWKYEGVDFEPAGIDHQVKGGSFATGKEIVKEVFGVEAPVTQIYEWVKPKGGTEFSSSSGNALSLGESLEIFEPEVLRYMFVKTRPKSGFQISFDNDIIKIYDEFDLLERNYYSGGANARDKRIYEMSMLKVSKKQPKRVGFRHLITLVQIGKVKEGEERAEKVKNWLEKYAGEDMTFEVQKKGKKLSGKDREAMLELKKSLESKNFTEDELFDEFYVICEKVGVKNTDFFKTAYLVLIGKEKGPRLASLILEIGKERVIGLLKEIK